MDNPKFFVKQDSVVRQIWGKSDTVLFIFAGASAEFALNKAVDWLYFTGQLPADPLGRLFSTVSYAGRIIYLPYEQAIAAIDAITNIHKEVEDKREGTIPQWAYRDVLYMLIGLSINAYELLERKLSIDEKEEVFDVFQRVGTRMGIENLPTTYGDWLTDRKKHLRLNLERSRYTEDLYRQYKRHLGFMRFQLLLQVQQLVCPPKIKELLNLKTNPIIPPALIIYKISRPFQIDYFLKLLLLPSEYKKQIRQLDRY